MPVSDADRVLWHVARRGSITRSSLLHAMQSALNAADLDRVLAELIADGRVVEMTEPSKHGVAARRYEVGKGVKVKRLKAGRDRADTMRNVTSVYMSTELRAKLEDAADAKGVSLSREIYERLLESCK